MTLSLCSMFLFILLGLSGMLQQVYAVSPSQSMKGLAASLPGHLFDAMLGMELRRMQAEPNAAAFQAGNLAVFLLRFLTDLNPDDPRSLLAREMPGMQLDRSVLLRSGSGGIHDAPEDLEPTMLDHRGGAPESRSSLGLDQQAEAGSDSKLPIDRHDAEQHPSPQQSLQPNIMSDRKVVFIYHSHNRESWLPELSEDAGDPSDDKINITLVGKRLAEQLEAQGIGAAHSNKDYASTVPSYSWNNSYQYSRQTVEEALATYEDLNFIFDIHRDSQRRSKTTVKIRGVDYAQVYFIIGHKNPNWKQNEAFASRIQEKLERDYPGLSRGIWGKSAANGNGEYNQSVSPGSVLIEIGGIENTLRESYRTADALAKAIAEVYWENQEAQKVDASLAQK